MTGLVESAAWHDSRGVWFSVIDVNPTEERLAGGENCGVKFAQEEAGFGGVGMEVLVIVELVENIRVLRELEDRAVDMVSGSWIEDCAGIVAEVVEFAIYRTFAY
jgi:hypothetical protein